jgi:hypothetical protein
MSSQNDNPNDVCKCMNPNSKEVRKAYTDRGYNPDDPASVQQADIDAYNSLTQQQKDQYQQQAGESLPNMGIPGAFKCVHCRCRIYLHLSICIAPPPMLFGSCYAHPLTWCKWEADTV